MKKILIEGNLLVTGNELPVENRSAITLEPAQGLPWPVHEES
jgi:hypothetical protein